MKQLLALLVGVLLLPLSTIATEAETLNDDPEASMQTDFRNWDVLHGREARLVDRERDWLRFEDRDGKSSAVPLNTVQGDDRVELVRAYREQRSRQASPQAREYFAGLEQQRLDFIRGLAKAINEKDFEFIEKTAESVRQETGLAPWDAVCGKLEFFYRILANKDNGPDEHLQQWVQESPQSQTAHLAAAYREITNGWQARGRGSIATVTPEGYREFEQCIARASDLLEKARELPGDDPDLYRQLIEVAKTQGWPREESMALVDELMKKHPKYFSAHQGMAELLLPQWGGAPGEMERYAKRVSDEIGDDDGKIVYARITQRIANYYSKLFLFLMTKFDYGLVREGLLYSIEQSPQHLLTVNHLIALAYGRHDPGTAQIGFEMLEQHGNAFDGETFHDLREYNRARRWAALAKDSDATRTMVPSNYATRLVQYMDEAIVLSIGGRESGDDRMTAWRSSDQQALPHYALDYPLGITVSKVATCPKRVIVAGTDLKGQGRLITWRHEGVMQMFPKQEWSVGKGIVDLAASPDGTQVALLQGQQQVVLRELSERGDERTIELDEMPAAVAFSKNGQHLAVGRADGICEVVSLDDSEKGRFKKMLNARPVTQVCFVSDSVLCAGQKDGSIFVWHIDRAGAPARIAAPADLRDLNASADGRLIASAHGEDRLVVVWHADTQQELKRLAGHKAEVTSVHFSPNSAVLATGSVDGSVCLWELRRMHNETFGLPRR